MWIKVAMTSDGSRLGFIMQIYQQVDAALGTDYFAQYSGKKLTIEHHLVAVSKILFNCFLGALIVEEIQPRNFGEAASRDVMLLFFFVWRTSAFRSYSLAILWGSKGSRTLRRTYDA